MPAPGNAPPHSDALDIKPLENSFHQCLLKVEQLLLEETKRFMHRCDSEPHYNSSEAYFSWDESTFIAKSIPLPLNEHLAPPPKKASSHANLEDGPPARKVSIAKAEFVDTKELFETPPTPSMSFASLPEPRTSRESPYASTMAGSRSLNFPSLKSVDVDAIFQEHHKQEISGILRVSRTNVLTNQYASNLSILQDRCCHFSCLRRQRTEERLDFFMAMVVIMNVVQLGVSADVARNWKGWLVVDCFFAGAFLAEFCMKILIHGCYKHFVVFWKWSLFDAIVVVVAMFELAGTIFLGAEGTGGAGGTAFLLRVVRLLRLVRIVKVIRLPMFKDLLLMCDGLIHGARTLLWSMVLLFTPVYASAILLRETVGEDEEHSDAVFVKPFTTLYSSFFTTFRCIMGDCSAETGQPLPVLLTDKFGWGFAFSYTCLIVVMSFGLFNVIIAIYVENIIVSTRKKDASQRREKYADSHRMNTLLAELIHCFVAAQLGSDEERGFANVNVESAAGMQISKEFFEEVVNTDEVHHIFDELDIPYEERQDLFDVLDAEASGTLNLGAITEGLKKLRGVPRRSDVVANGLATRAMQKRINLELESMSEVVRHSSEDIDVLKIMNEHTNARNTKQIDEIRLELTSLRNHILENCREEWHPPAYADV